MLTFKSNLQGVIDEHATRHGWSRPLTWPARLQKSPFSRDYRASITVVRDCPAKQARGAAPRRRHNGPGACSTVSVYPMERARCVGAAEPHRSRAGGRCAWWWQKRMKDGRTSEAHELGLMSLVPCTDRQVDLTGCTACANDVPTRGNPRQGPRRDERGVLYAERAGCTRGAGEVRGEDVRGTIVRLAKAAAGVHGTYVRHAVTAQEARGGGKDHAGGSPGMSARTACTPRGLRARRRTRGTIAGLSSALAAATKNTYAGWVVVVAPHLCGIGGKP